MRSFLRALLRRRSRHPQPPQKPTSTQTRLLSSGMSGITAYACSMGAPSALGAVPEDTAAKAHHVKNGKGFINPWDSWHEMSAPKIMWNMASGQVTGKLKWPDTTPPHVTVVKPTFLPTRDGPANLRATWLGHACYYVEFPSGLRVLFDPVFEERCSPFSFMGPKRYNPAPCHLNDIPIVDLVIISHSHYDHLSHPTVLALAAKHPNAHFLVGLGLKKWFHASGIKNVEEFDWWNDVDVTLSPSTGAKTLTDVSPDSTSPEEKKSASSDITARISCLPCQHISARTAFDKAHTLWASWAVTSGGKSVWFGGDTGYRAVPEMPEGEDDYGPKYAHLPHCPAFKQIGELRGPFDLGLIPIGAYDPRAIMSSMHANPFDSVNIFVDTKCKRAMGIHWGTWVLTCEDVLEPPMLLKQAMAKKGLPETGVFDVCDIGESREF